MLAPLPSWTKVKLDSARPDHRRRRHDRRPGRSRAKATKTIKRPQWLRRHRRSRRPDWETLVLPQWERPFGAPVAARSGAGRGDPLRRRGRQDPPARRADGLRSDANGKKTGRLRKRQGGGGARAGPGAAAGRARPSGAAPLAGGSDVDRERRFWLPIVCLHLRIWLRASIHGRGAHPGGDGRRAHAPAGGDGPPVHAARAEGRAGAGDVRRRSAVGVRPHALPRRRTRGARSPGILQRGAESLPLSAPLLVTSSGWVLFERSVGRLRHFDAFAMLASLRAQREDDAACRRRGGVPGTPLRPAHASEAGASRRTLPRGKSGGPQQPHLKIGPPAPRADARGAAAASDRPTAELSFRYDGLPIASADPRAT